MVKDLYNSNYVYVLVVKDKKVKETEAKYLLKTVLPELEKYMVLLSC